jgi:hypothetical protein
VPYSEAVLPNHHTFVLCRCLAAAAAAVQATKNVLDVAREKGASHFVLLSAICVQKPLLEFQRAKLKLEGDLQVRGGHVQKVRSTCRTSGAPVREPSSVEQLWSMVSGMLAGPPTAVSPEGGSESPRSTS